jgi:uncharacterized membrane protein
MESRPKIQLTPSSFDKALSLASIFLLVIIWVLTIYTVLKSPTTIPIHFNATGNADGYGPKLILFILPAIATLIHFGLTKLNNYPHIFNYVNRITEDNAEKQYTIATRMLSFLKLALLLIFALIILFTHLTTIGVRDGLGRWFLPMAIGLIALPMIYFLKKSIVDTKGRSRD